jgi:hypothetical protein
MLLLASALIIAAAIVWGAWAIANQLKRQADGQRQSRAHRLLTLLASGASAAQNDPRALLVWVPIARTARQVCPDDFKTIEAAAGSALPFGPEQIQAAHAQWTADWLAWERTHDADYKLKAADVEAQLAVSGGSPLLRSRLESIEREKLERYQQRYAEYVRVAKALQALLP